MAPDVGDTFSYDAKNRELDTDLASEDPLYNEWKIRGHSAMFEGPIRRAKVSLRSLRLALARSLLHARAPTRETEYSGERARENACFGVASLFFLFFFPSKKKQSLTAVGGWRGLLRDTVSMNHHETDVK